MGKKKIIILSIIICMIGAIATYFLISSNHEEKEDKIANINTNDDLQTPVSIYNHPTVPEGFKKVETESASWKLENGVPKGWNKGLVIEDDIGNQFVWVPVNIDEMNVKDTYHKDLMDIEEKEDLQILKYEGFYIARYEAGLPKEVVEKKQKFSVDTNNIKGIPVSKKDQIVWNFIEWNTAQKNAKLMYNNENIESSLITQKQWNYIMYWLEENGYDTENSIKWGNHGDSNFEFTGYYSNDYGKTYQYGKNKMKHTYNMILSTGATQRNMANNIYDLAGNVSEFVAAYKNKEGTYSYSANGGNYDNLGRYYSSNINMGISNANSRQGFRVVIYFK